MDFEKVKHWYDGYLLGKEHIYNPKAVVSVMMRGEYQSYWSNTGTYTSILPLINMDFDGLRTAIIQVLSGAAVEVDINTFQNDMISFQNKDDVITLLIHLGYLDMTRSIERLLFQMRKSGRNLSLQRKAKSGMNCLIFRENQKNYWKQP